MKRKVTLVLLHSPQGCQICQPVSDDIRRELQLELKRLTEGHDDPPLVKREPGLHEHRYAIIADGRPVGLIGFTWGGHPAPADVSWFVAPEYAYRGLGSGAVDELAVELKRHGISEIQDSPFTPCRCDKCYPPEYRSKPGEKEDPVTKKSRELRTKLRTRLSLLWGRN